MAMSQASGEASPARNRPSNRLDRRAVQCLILARLLEQDKPLPIKRLLADVSAVAPKAAPAAAWRDEGKAAVEDLLRRAQIVDQGGLLALSASGRSFAAKWLGLEMGRTTSWTSVRDTVLVARALGYSNADAPAMRRLSTLEGLYCAIVGAAIGQASAPVLTPTKLRARLADRALHKAFAGGRGARLPSGSKLDAASGRMLAAQLLPKPKSFATDAKLIEAFAMEVIPEKSRKLPALRAAVMRRFLTTPAVTDSGSGPVAGVGASKPPNGAHCEASRADVSAKADISIGADRAQFVAAVKKAAATRAQGWPGNRHAFISHVWEAIRAEHGQWGLTETGFKSLLIDAHLAGEVALSFADLKHKGITPDLQASEIAHRNGKWHFVRVE